MPRSARLALGALLVATWAAHTPAQARSAPNAYPPDGCSFATVSSQDQQRYRSRYERRVRDKGQAHAEAWLRSWLCPTQAEADRRQRARQQGPTGADGSPCRTTRTEMRPVSSGGSMTMLPFAVCAD